MNAAIVRPATDAQKTEIARIYPDDADHNVPNVPLRGNGVVVLVDMIHDLTVGALESALREVEGRTEGRDACDHHPCARRPCRRT